MDLQKRGKSSEKHSKLKLDHISKNDDKNSCDLKVMLMKNFQDFDPPVLENQLNFEQAYIANANLPPPKLELEEKIEVGNTEKLKPTYNFDETETLPKELQVKLLKEKLQPKSLTVYLSQLKETEPSGEITCNSHSLVSLDLIKNSQEPYDLIQCHMCPEIFKTFSALKRHLLKQHHSNEFNNWMKCEKCAYITNKKSNYKMHVQYGHDTSRPFKCKFCDFRAYSKHQLTRHELSHKDPKDCEIYCCNDCDYKTKYKQCMRLHRQNHKNIEFKCPQCTYKSCNVINFKAHLYGMHRKKFKTCATCEKSIDRRFFDTHLLSHSATSDEMMQCSKCSYRSLYMSNMERHKKRHRSTDCQKFVKCPECSYKTTDTGNLKRHYLGLHSPDSCYPCDLCNFTSTHKSSLKLHMNTQHTNYSERIKFQCLECPKQFLTDRGLKVHVLTKHKNPEEVTKYSCMHCSYSSVIKQPLQKHVIAKHCVKPRFQHLKFQKLFQCLECDYKVKKEKLMEEHIQEEHSLSGACQYEVCEVPQET